MSEMSTSGMLSNGNMGTPGLKPILFDLVASSVFSD
jgi:hypothetical protein